MTLLVWVGGALVVLVAGGEVLAMACSYSERPSAAASSSTPSSSSSDEEEEDTADDDEEASAKEGSRSLGGIWDDRGGGPDTAGEEGM